jgi:hypothetical protein
VGMQLSGFNFFGVYGYHAANLRSWRDWGVIGLMGRGRADGMRLILKIWCCFLTSHEF